MRSYSISDQIYSDLEKKIILGEIKRDEVLTELKLSEIYGVSRTPIREALAKLEDERLIKSEAKKSYVLGITNDDLKDLYDIRYNLEPHAVVRFINNSTKEKLAALNDIVELQEFYFSKSDSLNGSIKDFEFHEYIYNNCGSFVYSDVLSSISKKLQLYRMKNIIDETRYKESFYEHLEIFKAIVNNDTDLAFKLSAQHILNAKANLGKK